MSGEDSMNLHSNLLKHAVALFHGVPHLLVVERLLSAPRISDTCGRLHLALQPEDVLAGLLNFEQAFVKRLLVELASDRLVISKKLSSCKNNNDVSEKTQLGYKHGRVLVGWGVDFTVAVDVLYFKMYQMNIKLEKMRGTPTHVLFCPICNVEVSDSDMDRVVFETNTGEPLCPSHRPSCVGQRLVDREDTGPSNEFTTYATDIIKKQTYTLQQLMRDVYRETPPLYAWPVETSQTTEKTPPIADEELLRVTDTRPPVPWFSSGSACASRSSGVVEDTNEDTTEDITEDITEDGDFDRVQQFYATWMKRQEAAPAISPVPKTSMSYSETEDSDEWGEETVTVNGVEKLLSAVTEEDQQNMTQEEHDRLWSISHDLQISHLQVR